MDNPICGAVTPEAAQKVSATPTKPIDSAPVPPRKLDTMTVAELAGALTVSQVWAIAAALIGLAGGAAAAGGWIASGRAESASAQSLSSLQTQNSKLSQQVEDLTKSIEAAGRSVNNQRAQVQALEGEVEFLNRYLSYKIAPSPASRAVFVNFVCAMWRQNQQRRVRVDQAPLDLPSFRAGTSLPPAVVRLLENNGVSPSLIEQATTPPVVQRVGPLVQRDTGPSVQRAFSELQKQASTIRLTKIVTFSDGLRFELPPEIAAEVHMKPECAP